MALNRAGEREALSPGVLSRGIALDLLQAVLRRRQALDDAVAANAAFSRLLPRDRANVRRMVTIALRRSGQIDDLLKRLVARPLPARGMGAHDILRLGAAQLLFADTPPHAAVDTAVQLAEARRQGDYAGLVNGVLRRIARDGPALLGGQDAARLNTPDWLWQSWADPYGEAVARAIAEAHLEEPPLDITLRDEASRPAWEQALAAEPLPTGGLRRPTGGLVSELPGYDEGTWWIQDAAASLPVRLLGNVAGRSVVDLAAAPGGKTLQLAARGARVTAVDISARRMALVQQNLERCRLAADCVVADAKIWRPASPADAVLLDAPCSATGTVRRHPDVMWLKSPADIDRLAALQDRLLAAAVAMTAPRGRIVYACCSLQRQEGPDRIEALLRGGAPVTREPVEPQEVGGLAELITAEGDVRTFPFHLGERGGMDGFYMSRLVRNAS